MAKEVDYTNQNSEETNFKLRDLEEKQRILKDRIILIGQNLIDIKEKTQETILEMKKELEKNKEIIERME